MPVATSVRKNRENGMAMSFPTEIIPVLFGKEMIQPYAHRYKLFRLRRKSSLMRKSGEPSRTRKLRPTGIARQNSGAYLLHQQEEVPEREST